MGIPQILRNLFARPGKPPGPRDRKPSPSGHPWADVAERGHTGTVYPGGSFDPSVVPGTGGETLEGIDLDSFIKGEQIQFVDSSWLSWIKYNPSGYYLQIAIQGGGIYTVGNISPLEALDFAQAPSKGRWFWDNIAVRGEGNKGKYQKPTSYSG